MFNFVSFMECLNRPGAACLISLPVLALLLAGAAGAVSGFRQKARDVAAFKTWRKRLLLASSALIGTSLLMILLFGLFNPSVLLGVETNALLNGVWIAAVEAFGLGLYLVLAATGFALGGALRGTA